MIVGYDKEGLSIKLERPLPRVSFVSYIVLYFASALYKQNSRPVVTFPIAIVIVFVSVLPVHTTVPLVLFDLSLDG